MASSAAKVNDEPSWPMRRDMSLTRCRSDSYIELDAYLKSLVRTIPDFPKPGQQYRYVFIKVYKL